MVNPLTLPPTHFPFPPVISPCRGGKSGSCSASVKLFSGFTNLISISCHN